LGCLTEQLYLIDFQKINTIDNQQAKKVMQLAAMACNLKKYLKFTQKLARSEAKTLVFV